MLEGKAVLVTAQTGSGKTAAFLLPILSKMLAAAEENDRQSKALIIAPTRELAEQIGQVARELTFFARRYRYSVIIGGSGYGKQLSELRNSPSFVIGTPGRLIDHIGSGALRLDAYDFLVLDEADRMLDMGFAPQIEEIVKSLPAQRQTMMFSATLPPEVRKLVSTYLKDPVRISIGEENKPVERIQQDVIQLREGEKDRTLLAEIDKVAGSVIVFTKTKVKADKVAAFLAESGHKADSLHGDLTQGARRRVTMNFRDEKIRILVATDIAARGLDIAHIRHVVNYDLPMLPEDYVHRIGRTARAGSEGHSIAFVTPNESQKWYRILRMMGQSAPRVVGGPAKDRGGRRNDGKFRGASDTSGRPGFREQRVRDRDDSHKRLPFNRDERPRIRDERPRIRDERVRTEAPRVVGSERPARSFDGPRTSAPRAGVASTRPSASDSRGADSRGPDAPPKKRLYSRESKPGFGTRVSAPAASGRKRFGEGVRSPRSGGAPKSANRARF